jgi:hypothetical protein
MSAPPSSSSSSPMTTYVIAIVALSMAGAGGVLAITLLGDPDTRAATIATLLGFLAPVITTLGALMARDVHLSLNSRLDQLVQASGRAGHAEGVIEGRGETPPAMPAP